jgi:hypothetical protein
MRLSEREPEFAGVLAPYAKLSPPYGAEAEEFHGHLLELFKRADEGVPPYSAAEFADLAAWLAGHGDGLPTTGAGSGRWTRAAGR